MSKRFLWILGGGCLVCLFFVSVMVCAFLVYKATKEDTVSTFSVPTQQAEQQMPAETQPQSELLKQETSAPAPTQKAASTLHVSPQQFRERYNEYLHSKLGEAGALELSEPVIKSGSVNDVVKYVKEDLNFGIIERIDKNTGEIIEVQLTSLLEGKDKETVQASLMAAVISYCALMHAVDPEVDSDSILKDLGLTNSVDEWVKDTNTTYNGVKYFKGAVKGVGALQFGASAI